MDWAVFLTQPLPVIFLVTVGLTCLLWMFLSPGIIPGVVGLAAFGLYFWAHNEMGLLSWSIIFLFLVGLALIMVEIWLPTLGVLGILGFISILYSLVSTASHLWLGIVAFALGSVVALLVGWLAVKKLGLKPAWKKWFVLESRLTKEEGYSSSVDRSDLLGQEGITLTPLRPSGYARFGERKVDVVSEGEIIASGETVKVVHVEGAKVIVRKAQ